MVEGLAVKAEEGNSHWMRPFDLNDHLQQFKTLYFQTYSLNFRMLFFMIFGSF